jgi:hypothetical protein
MPRGTQISLASPGRFVRKSLRRAEGYPSLETVGFGMELDTDIV